MAASKWQIYNSAKKKLLTGLIDLDSGAVRMKLLSGAKSAAVSNYARILMGSLTHMTTNLSAALMTVSGYVVGSVGSAKQIMFDSTAVIFKATGGAVAASIQYAVIGVSGASAGSSYAIGWCKLSTAVFGLSDGNTLTITPSATGYFTLTGGTTA